MFALLLSSVAVRHRVQASVHASRAELLHQHIVGWLQVIVCRSNPFQLIRVIIDVCCRSSLTLVEGRAEWPHGPQELENVEIFHARTRRGNKIACMYVRPCPDAHFTLLFSHGNAVDLGQMCSFYYGLGYRLGCNVFSYDYSGTPLLLIVLTCMGPVQAMDARRDVPARRTCTRTLRLRCKRFGRNSRSHRNGSSSTASPSAPCRASTWPVRTPTSLRSFSTHRSCPVRSTVRRAGT